MINEIIEFSEIEKLVADKANFVLYFYNDQCAPCISLRPKVDDLIKSEFPELKLIFINSNNNPEICGRFNVFVSPLILVFFEGKECIRKSKMVSLVELDNEIERLYNLFYE